MAARKSPFKQRSCSFSLKPPKLETTLRPVFRAAMMYGLILEVFELFILTVLLSNGTVRLRRVPRVS